MADFDGIIDPEESWADVPQLSTYALALGGIDGPMNAQAVALTKRTKALLRSQMERVALELGLNLVSGSFEDGATLDSPDDAIICYAENKLLIWGGEFEKYVHKNSTPAGTGGIGSNTWIDTTRSSFRNILAGVGGAKLIGCGDKTLEDVIDGIRNPISPLTLENIPVANILASLRADKIANVNIIPIADSFGDGVGASVYGNRYLKMFEAAINYANIGGFGYASDSRLTDVVNVTGSGVTTNGAVTQQGSLQSRINLADGKYIEITGFQADYLDLWYDGGLTTGDLIIYLNGSQVREITTKKIVGIRNTFDGNKLPVRSSKSDVIRFQAAGGNISVSALMPLRGPTGGLWQAKVSHGGWSYKTYNQQAIVDEIGAYAQFRNAYAVYFLLLGTNSIYNNSEAQTPSEMIAEMQSFITKLAAKTPNCGFIIGVPPKSNESIWPVIKHGYSHADYVSSIVNFCANNGVQCIRFDSLSLFEKGLYSDGVHPDDRGHILYFKRLCDTIGIPAIAYIDDMEKQIATQNEISASVIFNSTWGPFLNDIGSVPRVRMDGNIAYMSGAVQANGSSSQTVMSIPVAFRPLSRNVNCLGLDESGVRKVSVLSTGNVVVDGMPNTWLSFEVSWIIDNSK